MKLLFTSRICRVHKKTTLLVFLWTVLFHGAFAQVRPFQTISKSADPAFFQSSKKYFTNVRLYEVDLASIRQQLAQAPLQGQGTATAIPMQVPMPDGTSEVFNMIETPLLAPAVAKQFPDIKTYTGYGQKNKKATISISITSSGLNAIILNTDNGPVYIEKTQGTSKKDRYRSYYTKDAIIPQTTEGDAKRPHCGTIGEMGLLPDLKSGARKAANIGIGNNTVGTQFRTFKLAIAVTGEFTLKHGGQTKAFNDIVAYLNRGNAVYKNELCVNFSLVSSTNVVYPDPTTDPFSGTNTSAMSLENQPVLDNAIGDANYDLGMAVTATYPTVAGNTSSGGGEAILKSLGKTGTKARDAIQEGDFIPDGDSFSQLYTDQVFVHEIGHQFGMLHTFNSNLGACANNGTPEGSVEPGAGVTIMSYGYTCENTNASKPPIGDDNYGPSGLPNGPILNFHAGSYAAATDYMATIPSVGTSVATNNTPPVVTVPVASYTIPKSTPFYLTGSATDADNDALTYSWEGIDIGTTATPDPTVFADPSKPPFFRSYAPSAAGNVRTYPILAAILDGTNTVKGEKLPSATFSTTHRLTARDNSSKGGGVASRDVTVNVDGNTGPFLVSNDWQGNYNGSTTQTVSWSVNGTNTATPNVKISLSTDGGQTFPTVLAASVPNTGTASVTVPNVATTTGRIKVEAVGNIFFDISNKNFSIIPSDITPVMYTTPSVAYGGTQINVVVDLYELNNVNTSVPVKVSISRDMILALSFDQAATTVGTKSVNNNAWSFDNTNQSVYVLTTLPNQIITAGGKLSLGLSGILNPNNTNGTITISAIVMLPDGTEATLTNNIDSDKVEYFAK